MTMPVSVTHRDDQVVAAAIFYVIGAPFEARLARPAAQNGFCQRNDG
jgi:hypothetical protein